MLYLILVFFYLVVKKILLCGIHFFFLVSFRLKRELCNYFYTISLLILYIYIYNAAYMRHKRGTTTTTTTS